MNTSDDFRPLLELVAAASINDGAKRTLSWCLGQLPTLYEKFGETHDIYFSDKIAHLEDGVLKELRKDKKNAELHQLSEDVLAGLKAIHEKHGLQSLDPKPAKPAVPRRKVKVPVVAPANMPPISAGPGHPGV